jgi:tRNA dimethylallyltransferase
MSTTNLLPVVIAGPTASGKSSLALYLAKRYHGEIICADSRQFYRGMSIGTACPSAADMAAIPHHGYGIIDPARSKIDAGFFINFAKTTISEVQKRKKRPLVVGGTGLYLRALRYGLNDVPPSNPGIIASLRKRAEQEGIATLYADLLKIDPILSERIKASDHYRIIRAWEIYTVTKQKPSFLQKSFFGNNRPFSAHWIYKKPDKDQLFGQIITRVNEMFTEGLIDEAATLRKKLSPDHWALTVMGYHEALQFLDGKIPLDEAKQQVIIRHRQYAKRQFTWFNKEPFYSWVIP